LPIPLQGSGAFPRLSDDSQALLYATGDPSAYEIWHYDLRTRTARFLFQEAWLQVGRWLPASSSEFLFRRVDGRLYRHDVVTQESSLWQDNDTARAAYGVDSYGIVDWEATFEKAVVQVHHGGAGGMGVFQGDLCAGDPAHHICNLQPVAFPGGGSTSWSDVAYSPAISPDGTRVYFVLRRNWTSYRIVGRDLASGDETTLLSQEGDPAPNVHGLFEGSQLVISAPSLSHPGSTALSVCDLESSTCNEIYRVPRAYGISDALAGPSFIALPPHAAAGEDVTVEGAGPLTPVRLSCAGSSDPMGGQLTCTWSGPFAAVTGSDPFVELPRGTHLITLTVESAAGLSDVDELVVTVVDTTPPLISAVAPSASVLWPPNHRMRSVTIAASVTDLVDASPTCGITSVTSNEPIEGLGGGDRAPDWSISGPLTVSLRAERSRRGHGRVYTITVTCTDDAGNSATATTGVTVPHSHCN
jgi:hypothetical protein